MPLKAAPAQWFEIYVPRDETVYALEVLAGSGHVQLEQDPAVSAPLRTENLRTVVEEFTALAAQYQQIWPASTVCPTTLPQAPERTAAAAMDTLRQWAAVYEDLGRNVARLEAERANLVLLRECVTALGNRPRDMGLLARPTGFLFKGLFACPQGEQLDLGDAADEVLQEVVDGPHHRFLVTVALAEQAQVFTRALMETSCHAVQVPAWLDREPQTRDAQLGARLADIAAEVAQLHAQREALARDNDLIGALGNMTLIRWYMSSARAVGVRGNLCHVTGWTGFPSSARLETVLRRARIHAVVRFSPEPLGMQAPVRGREAWWARPFEPWLRMFGAPGTADVDPTGILALVVPLLFGYMFPDVGHGLVLVLLSGALYRRWPSGRFLIPCGIAAMLFGLVFGEVFGVSTVVPRLWVDPLAEPLAVMVAPMVVGAGLIALSMVLAGLQAHWRHDLRGWLLVDGALLPVYFGLLGALVYPDSLWVAAFSGLWYLAGGQLLYGRWSWSQLLAALGQFAESVFQLAVNTLSFARVGAFALAHAGFSTAIWLLAESVPSGPARMVMLVLGHTFLIALEGLVVYVQTTRLVFFEFFIRFMRGEGRVFQPLQPPSGAAQTPPRSPFS